MKLSLTRSLAACGLLAAALLPGVSHAVGIVTLNPVLVLSDSVGANPAANSVVNLTGNVAIGTGNVGVTVKQTQTGLLAFPAPLYDFGYLWGSGTSAVVMSPFVGDNTSARTPSFTYNYTFDQGLNGLKLTDLGHWLSEYTTFTFSWTAASTSGTWTTNNTFPWTSAYTGSASAGALVADGSFASGTPIRFDYDGVQGNNSTKSGIYNNYNFSDWTLALPDDLTALTVQVDVNVPAALGVLALPGYRGHIGYEEVALNFDSAVISSVTGGGNGGGPISAIPEPETYAMMLAGLGTLGAMARRRRNGVKA